MNERVLFTRKRGWVKVILATTFAKTIKYQKFYNSLTLAHVAARVTVGAREGGVKKLVLQTFAICECAIR